MYTFKGVHILGILDPGTSLAVAQTQSLGVQISQAQVPLAIFCRSFPLLPTVSVVSPPVTGGPVSVDARRRCGVPSPAHFRGGHRGA